jgi:GT2 family glycosyltransferase
MPEISVLLVNWNGRNMLADCLGALRRQTFRDFETILVDNGSTDDSPAYIQTEFPEVRLIALRENGGFTGGNIAAYEHAQGQLIVLLNNDTEADPHWLEEIHKASLLFPNAGTFASKMMYFNDRGRIENCGFSLGVAGTTVDLGRDELDGPKWTETRAIFGGCGGAVAYRRSMLDDIGFLDPDFFIYYEDVDLSFRAQLRGYGCIYVPNAIVFHRYSSTMGKRPARQIFYAQRNIEFVYLKNMPSGLVFRFFLQRLMYELGAAVYFCRQGGTFPFIRAKWEAIKHLPVLVRKRRQVQKSKTVGDAQLRTLMEPTFSTKWRKLISSFLPSNVQAESHKS